MIIDLFGKEIEVIKKDSSWRVFYRGHEGKRRSANDIVIPGSIKESEVAGYLSDIYHEFSTPNKPEARIIG